MPGADGDAAQAAVQRLQDALHRPVEVHQPRARRQHRPRLVPRSRERSSHTSSNAAPRHVPREGKPPCDLPLRGRLPQPCSRSPPPAPRARRRPDAAPLPTAGRARAARRRRGARPLAAPAARLSAPLEFIEVAERTGLIKDLTHQVIPGLRDLERRGPFLSLSLNISVRSPRPPLSRGGREAPSAPRRAARSHSS